MKKLIITVLVLTICASQSFAFDGVRKGFALGGGVNFAPYSKWEYKTPPLTKSSIAYGLNVLIGYNFDNRNLVAWQVVANSKFWDGTSAHLQAFSGICWNHYFKTNIGSVYSKVGIGHLFSGVSYDDPNAPDLFDEFGNLIYSNSKFPSLRLDFGYLIGGGYEISKHWHLFLCYYGGNADTIHNTKNNVISLSIIALAF